MAYVPPLNGGRINATISGNTAGAGALISTGTLALAGGNNITLSQNSNSISISAPAISSVNAAGIVNISSNGSNVTISAPAFSAGMGTAGNTAGNSSLVTNQLYLAGGNNITLSQTTGAGGATLSIVGGGGIALANSQTTYTSGTANLLEGGGAITIASTTGQKFNVSVPATSSLSVTGALSLSVNGNTVSIGAPAFSAGISNLGSTAGTSGTVSNQLIFAGSNITLSQNTGAGGNTITISGPNALTSQSNQALSAANGSFTFQTASFANSNGVSFSTGTQGIYASHNALTSQSNPALSGSNGSFAFQTATFGNLNGLSFYSSNGSMVGSYTVPPAFSAGVSTGGNTSNSSGVVGSRLVLAGGNNITLSQSNNGGSATITIVGAAGGGGGVALYDGANSISSGTARLSAGGALTASINGQTLSLNAPAQSSLSATGAVSISNNGSTISIGAPAVSSLSVTGGLNISSNGSTISIGAPLVTQYMHNSAGMYASGTGAITNNSATVVRMFIPNAISFTRADLPVSISVATAGNNSTSPINISRTAVIYTRSGSTLTPIAGGTDYGQYTFSSSNTASVAGAKILSVPVATTLAAGEYYLGVQLASAVTSIGGGTTNLGWTISPIFGSYQQPAWDYMNVTTALTNNGFQPMQGLISSGITNTTQTLQQSIISQGSTYGNRANLVVMFKNDYLGE